MNSETKLMPKVDKNSSYRSILKYTSILGGVQVWKILIGIIRTKLIAIILGSTGIGLEGLYNSSTEVIKKCTSMGLTSSAVKNISESNATNDVSRLSRTVSVFQKLVWCTGFFGMGVTILLSPILSNTTFGSYAYTFAFIALSVTLLFEQLTNGQYALLQGTSQIKKLSYVGIIGSVVGLIVSIPLYYFFRENGIVPSLIIISLSGYLTNRFFAKKTNINLVQISLRAAISEGGDMIKMGIAMSLTGILSTVTVYGVRVFISRMGGISEVGLFTSSMALLSSYVGLIFTAMNIDFYPRLSSVNRDNSKCRLLINNQIEVTLLILFPLLSLFILCVPLIIKLLYTAEFLNTTELIRFGILAIPFKAISQTVAFVFVAKADMKVYVALETIANVVFMVTQIAFYYFVGLTGLGIAFFINYLLYTLFVYIIARVKYDYSFSPSLVKYLLYLFVPLVIVFIVRYFISNIVWLVMGASVFVFASIYSIKSVMSNIK